MRARMLSVLPLSILVLLASCSPPEPPELPAAATAADGEPAIAAGDAGSMAPDFTLKDLDGRDVRLADSAGRVRLIDFWATWCAPCREEIPMFKELHRTYGPRGLTILAISKDEGGAEVVRPFVDKHGIPYTNLLATDEVDAAFGGVPGLPTTFLVDGQGKIVERLIGPKPRRVLEEKIRRLLGEEGA